MNWIPLFLQENAEIGHYSGYKTRVIARYFYELQSLDEVALLKETYAASQHLKLPIIFISGGTNMLFSSSKLEAIVIKNSLENWTYDANTKVLSCESASNITDIARSLEKEYQQNIWHRFIGLPGTIAGAVVGNAGCFWLEVWPFFVEGKAFDMKTWNLITLKNEDMNFEYRHSFLKENRDMFLMEASFDLSQIREKYASDADVIDFRENKQPKWNSCGSFFKNPSREHTAGALIEQVGLKWFRNKWAFWSDLHANFLMSEGETCHPEDLVELIEMTQKIVKFETGFELTPEIRII